MKKILIFIDWFVPGYKAGGPISSNANLIEHLKDDYEFYVLTRDTDYCETTPYPNVISNAWNTLPNGAKVYYLSTRKLGIQQLIRVCKTIEFDMVYVNGIYSVYFSLFPLLYFKYFTQKKVVVAARGMLSDHTFSSKKGKKRLFYTLAKHLGLYNKITFHATNDNEASQIRKNVGFKGAINVAPNLPPQIHDAGSRTRLKIPGEVKLISIARISPEKNTLFALEVLEKWSSVDSRQSTENGAAIIFDLYGTIYNEPYWLECQQIIRRLPSNITVNFCGSLEKERVQATLKEYDFLFMPSQGENFGHSIIESLLAGCPVIISDRTPWSNLNIEERQQTTDNRQQKAEDRPLTSDLLSSSNTSVGWDVPLEKPELFVQIIGQCCLMGEKEYGQMSSNASAFAKQVSMNDAVRKATIKLFE